jgi:FixJ family two-component response regulator
MEEKIITILFVDDDSTYVSVIKQSLNHFQDYRFSIIWEPKAEKVIERLKSEPNINILLMDYYLPEINGLEITKRISEENIHLPIIFLTANRDFRAAVEAMKYGAEDYLLKEELRDSLLSRSIVNVFERWHLKKRLSEAETQKMLLQKKTEAIRELVVTMCHEFNNPLAAIKISTAILTRQAIPEEEKKLLESFNINVSKLESQILKLRDLNFEALR